MHRPPARRLATFPARGGCTPRTGSSHAGSRTRHSPTPTGPRSRCPATGRAARSFAYERRPAALPPDLRGRGPRARPPPVPHASTASSTTATSGSTGATSVRPRATSSPTRSRSPSRPRRVPDGRPPARGRGRVATAARPHQEADHHRGLLALGQPRPGLEPRRHLAAGPAARHRPGAHQVAARAVHRSDRGPRPAAARRHARLRPRPAAGPPRCPALRDGHRAGRRS